MRRQPLPRTVMPWLLLATSSQLTLATDPVDWAALTVSDDPPLQYKGDVSQLYCGCMQCWLAIAA